MGTRLVKTQVTTCDRCAFNNVLEASEDRRFAIEDRYYELNLCAKHAEMFDRDIGNWTRLAQDIDNPYIGTAKGPRPSSQYFSEQRQAETRRLRDLTASANRRAAAELRAKERAAEIEEEERLAKLVNEDEAEREARRAAEELLARRSIPGAMKWRLTKHAVDRCELRGYTIYDALLTAARPDTVLQDPRGNPEVRIHERQGCKVVLSIRSYEIMTILDKTKSWYAEQPERKAQ